MVSLNILESFQLKYKPGSYGKVIRNRPATVMYLNRHKLRAVHAAKEGIELPLSTYEPPRLDVPALTVVTSDGYSPKLEEIVSFIRNPDINESSSYDIGIQLERTAPEGASRTHILIKGLQNW